ncbi:Acetyltransferase (GNAT) family protein [Sphingomonas guangdongensis]|uniref:Acetyltransferase (GNAT) family protein n=1 Tax=Sphingomonas guangdongensis TaxID=1141890 RepID=A0A285QYY5_9SPHN|nr:GNAT family N-acetyltransferase [Sphingomonas guangdongensis]SOB87123.1 Acetyltransferase (GNAT) family protein [Sphingomonas guangdongensis]
MLTNAEDADIPAIVSLLNRAYRGSGAEAGWNSEAGYIAGDRTTEALLRADLLAHPAASLLKWIDPESKETTGCVWLQPLGTGQWYMGSLATDPVRQNAGAGRKLLEAAEQYVRAKGGDRIRITVVNVRDTLIAWYERRGYTLTGETEPFPYDDDRFGTPLRDDLMFVVMEKWL